MWIDVQMEATLTQQLNDAFQYVQKDLYCIHIISIKHALLNVLMVYLDRIRQDHA